ncbi:metallophosphoesterase [soil metagenome]
MPAPDKILATLRKAIDAVERTPGRSGHLVHLQDCTEVLVVGDLHGHVGNFQSIWKLANLLAHPGRHLVLQELIHGKFFYPNGSEKSHQLVDLFAAVKCQFPGRVHYLPGNHEMAQWTGRKIIKGDEDLNELFRVGVLTAYGTAMMPEIYRAYFELFQKCPLGLVTPNAVFLSHTLPPARQLPLFDRKQLEAESFEAKDLEPGGLVYGMLWGRDTSAENAEEFLRKVECDWLVTGHIPSDDGFTKPNHRQITLDCSASPGGYVLLPCDRALSQGEFSACIGVV